MNLPSLAPGGSEVAEQDMDGEVPELSSEETAEEGVDLGGIGAGVERVVDVVADVSGKAPVVAAVLEQVHDGHRRVAEPVDEHSLKQPLSVVQHPSSSCNVRGEGEGRGGGGVQVPVGEPGPGVEPEVDQQRPRILAEEHSRPPNLKTSVLEVNN